MPLFHPQAIREFPSAARGVVSPLPFWWAAALSLLFAVCMLLPDIRLFQGESTYLPVHTALEFPALAVSCMLFGLGWSLQDTQYNSRFVLVSASFLYVGLMDFLHVLAFPGMPDLVSPSGLEKAINFWLAARLGAVVGIVSVILLPLGHWSLGRSRMTFGISLGAALAGSWVVLFHPGVFPRTYIPGEGLTPFKIGFEGLLALLYGGAALILYRRGRREEDDSCAWLGVGAWGLALAELFFTDYATESDLSNFLGHVYKVVAYWMIYHAIFEASVKLPYRALSLREEYLEGMVAARTAQLQAALDQSRAFIEQAPTAIAMFDRDMNYLAASGRWMQKYSGGLGSLVGRNYYQVHPDIPAHWKPAYQAALDGIPQINNEDLWARADGSRRWLHWRAYPWRNERGDISGLVIAAEDITPRKEAEMEIQRLNAELEDRVRERTAELERANEALVRSNMELQRFAHAAAHDLQTPLRSIAGFAQLLQKELQGLGGERVGEWLRYVVDNTKRLQALIQEMLAYSRLDARARPFELVPLRQLFDEAVAVLAALIEETGAEVSCGGLPALPVDRTQMVQLLQNLIENGIKYNHSKPPRVSVAAECRAGEWVFSVADNGIGIDPRHHERIFEIFRRLHSYSRIPGTGIGLAVCCRIVEHHGGRLWVESEPGKGSIFRFTLPERTEVPALLADSEGGGNKA